MERYHTRNTNANTKIILLNFCERFFVCIPIIRLCSVLSNFQFTDDSESSENTRAGNGVSGEVVYNNYISEQSRNSVCCVCVVARVCLHGVFSNAYG